MSEHVSGNKNRIFLGLEQVWWKIKGQINNFVRLKMEYFSNLPKDLTTINAEQSAKIQKTFEETAENKCKFLFETYVD